MGNLSIKLDTSRIEKYLDDLVKKIATSKYKGIKAGYFQGQKYANGFELAKNALLQNFGNEKIPPRPFLTNALDFNKKNWQHLFIKNLKKDMSLAQNLKITGVQMRNDIRKEIDRTVEPANSPSTIKIKKSSHPLFDTGLLKTSVMSELIKNGN